MSLFDELTRIGRRVESQLQLMRNNEDATILVSIQPFIRALGYDTQNLNEVYPQYNADPKATGGEKVDYAILREGEPVVLIEAKAAQNSLNENNWKQLYLYFNALDVRFGILTNGLEYRFYTDLKKRHIMDKQPFLTIDMLDLDKRSVAALELFTKTRFKTERIVGLAHRQRIKQLLQQEMENPSDALVDHFARDLHHGRMSANDRQQYRVLLCEAWREILDQLNPQLEPEPFSQPQTTQSTTNRDKFQQYESPAPPPAGSDFDLKIPVHSKYLGKDFDAELLYCKSNWKRSRIRIDDRILKPSASTLPAMQSVKPTQLNQQNGWDFWKLRDPRGNQERRIGDLREDDALFRRLKDKT